MKPVNCNIGSLTSFDHWCNSGTSIIEVTNYFLCSDLGYTLQDEAHAWYHFRSNNLGLDRSKNLGESLKLLFC